MKKGSKHTEETKKRMSIQHSKHRVIYPPGIGSIPHRVWFIYRGFKPDWKNKREIIHHIDGNHNNNSIENLQLMTQMEHINLHNIRLGKIHSEEAKRKIRDKAKQQKRNNGKFARMNELG